MRKKLMGGGMSNRMMYKAGSSNPKASKAIKKKIKKKNKFPDHSGDGIITKKDILMAKGVIPKTKGGKE